MKYKIYVNGSAGLYYLGEYNKEETEYCLNWLIAEEQTKEKILVIEHNCKDNIEFPVFIYYGKAQEYIDFINYLNSDETRVTKCFRKKKG